MTDFYGNMIDGMNEQKAHQDRLANASLEAENASLRNELQSSAYNKVSTTNVLDVTKDLTKKWKEITNYNDRFIVIYKKTILDFISKGKVKSSKLEINSRYKKVFNAKVKENETLMNDTGAASGINL